ncbi:hypothetical protein [Ancylobacter oerskovii]|uniref:Uncharacterized protein n=1 Tax=Ancylobacter oerskovii TaxID=459519 RepID=A0ABW4YSB2_9HYPH|nr:hypothetical protein [Ancylobacter oerskovii]MBS7545179.1 hypothetical protein [Ancylobacter oerskovii]
MTFTRFAAGGLAAALALGAFAATPASAQTYVTRSDAPTYGPAPVYEPEPVVVYDRYGSNPYVLGPHGRVIVDDTASNMVVVPRQRVVVPQPEPAPYPAIRVRSNFDDARVDPSSVRISPSGRMCRTLEVENDDGLLRQHTYCD